MLICFEAFIVKLQYLEFIRLFLPAERQLVCSLVIAFNLPHKKHDAEHDIMIDRQNTLREALKLGTFSVVSIIWPNDRMEIIIPADCNPAAAGKL